MGGAYGLEGPTSHSRPDRPMPSPVSVAGRPGPVHAHVPAATATAPRRVPEKQTPPRRSPLKAVRSADTNATLIVGVDFGTSSTKVVWQDLSENYFELFRWRPDLKGLESVLLPSTICVRAGTLVFGNSAPSEGDFWLPSIKLCVLCSRNPSVCRCDGSVAKCGQIQLPGMKVLCRRPLLRVCSSRTCFNRWKSALSRPFRTTTSS